VLQLSMISTRVMISLVAATLQAMSYLDLSRLGFSFP